MSIRRNFALVTLAAAAVGASAAWAVVPSGWNTLPNVLDLRLGPQVSMTYKLGAKTVVKANYALYADQLAISPESIDLGAAAYQYVYAYFDDGGGDEPATGPAYRVALDDLSFDTGSYTQKHVEAENTSPRTHETVLGLTRLLGADTSLHSNLTYRRRFNDLTNLMLGDLDVDEASVRVRGGFTARNGFSEVGGKVTVQFRGTLPEMSDLAGRTLKGKITVTAQGTRAF